MFTFMVKTITIKDEVYGLLRMIKRENESFSELLLRLIKSKEKNYYLLLKSIKKLNLKLKKSEKKKFLEEIERERWGR